MIRDLFNLFFRHRLYAQEQGERMAQRQWEAKHR